MSYIDEKIINPVLLVHVTQPNTSNCLGIYIEYIFREALTVLRGTFSTTKCTRFM